ncbi:histidine phosphatase family protein [Nocardioides piscis]|uniref:histidine phosphatase family protein n=1 Tax=Nocardioides piscis TaxID=2714938 RepID=UPI0019826F2A|nr:histidine phosphatase family protein [Nocardioides piscis]
MRLFLLRHGQTHANVSGELDTGVPGLELTDLGHQQAAAAARALTDAGITAIGVSSLTRTHQTARPLAEQLALDPSRHDGLREITAGDFEMRNDHDAIHGFLETIGAWLEDDLERRMPGGETGLEFLARYDDAIARLCSASPRPRWSSLTAPRSGRG